MKDDNEIHIIADDISHALWGSPEHINFYRDKLGECQMTDKEFMIGVNERLPNKDMLLVATTNEFMLITIEEFLKTGIKLKKEHMRFLI